MAGLAGCEVGPWGDDTEECLLYACVNEVALTGSVPVETELERLEATTCIADVCETYEVDLTTDAVVHCGFGKERSGVCIEQKEGKLQVSATWNYSDGLEMPRGVPHRLRLEDGATADVLVDETRASNPKVTREDNCHVCWRDEETF